MAASLEPEVFPLRLTDEVFLRCESYLLEFFMNRSYCFLELMWEVPIIEEKGFRSFGAPTPKSIKMIYNPLTYHAQNFNNHPEGHTITDSINYGICDLPDHTQIYRVVKEYHRGEGAPGPRVKRVIEFTPNGVCEIRIPGTSADLCNLPLPGLVEEEENMTEEDKEVMSYF